MTWPSDGVLPPPAICQCPPVSRLGHYPRLGHTLSTPGCRETQWSQTLIDQDFLGAVFTLHCPRVQISSPQIWFRDWESFRQMQQLNKPRQLELCHDKVILYSGLFVLRDSIFYGNWTSQHPSHIRIHFWVITHAHHVSCFGVATKQETRPPNSHE